MKSVSIVRLSILFSLMGFFISLYTFLHHQGFVSGNLCDINTTINCDVVNRGPFSILFGIPVSLIGVIGYAFLFFAAQLIKRNPSDQSLRFFLLLSSGAAVLFSFYLTGIEAFVLHAWCLICLTSQILILLIHGCAHRIFRSQPQ